MGARRLRRHVLGHRQPGPQREPGDHGRGRLLLPGALIVGDQVPLHRRRARLDPGPEHRPAAGGPVRRAASARPVRGIVNPRLSPDGESIVFGALADVHLLHDGKPEQLTDDRYWEYDFEWSRDGRAFTYTSDKAGSPDVYLRDVTTGEERQLTSLPGAEYGASLSPQGDRLAYLDEHNGSTC
jgi:hypothetical protein